MMKVTSFYTLREELERTRASPQQRKSIEIDFDDFMWPDDKLRELCNLLKTANITTISFANSQLPDARAAAIINALAVNPYLEQLDLSHNQLGSASAAALKELIKAIPELNELNISHNPLGDHVVTVLAAITGSPAILGVLMQATHPLAGAHTLTVAQTINLSYRNTRFLDIGSNMFTAAAHDFLAGRVNNDKVLGFASCSKPATRDWYYAVSETEQVYKAEYYSEVTVEAALAALKKSDRCLVYQQENSANTQQTNQSRTSGFWPGTYYPAQFKIMSTSDFFYNGMKLENHHIDTVIYVSRHWRDEGTLLRSRLHEEELRNVVIAAYDDYAGLHTPSTSTSSGADEGRGICSTTSSTSRRETSASHSQAGVDRAMKFKESLEGLEYAELTKTIRAHVTGWLTGGYEKGQSFKAILYEKLIAKYGTEREKRLLASKTIISEGDLLDALTRAETVIEAAVREHMSVVPAHRHQR